MESSPVEIMARCTNCGGAGYRFQAPRGVNTFLCSINDLARVLKRVRCWTCNGTGQEATASPLHASKGRGE